MADSTVDYDTLAAQHGGSEVDYDELAKQHGGIEVSKPTTVFRRVQKALDFTQLPGWHIIEKAVQPRPGDNAGTQVLRGAGRLVAGGATLGRDLAAGAVDPVGAIPAGINDYFVEPAKREAEKARQYYDKSKTFPLKARIENVKRGNVFYEPDEAEHMGNVHAMGAAIPVIGPMAAEWEEATHAGSPVQAFTEAVGTASAPDLLHGVSKVAPKVAEAVAKPATQALEAVRNNPVTNLAIGPNPEAMPPVKAITKALRPRNSIQNWPDHAERALPDVRRAVDNLGIDPSKITLEDAEQAVSQAKKDVWQEFEDQHLGPHQNIGFDTTPVANKIESIGAQMTDVQKRRLGNIVDEISDHASDYDGKVMKLGDVEDRIQELNNQLRSQQATFKVNEMNLRNDPKFAHLFAELDGLREVERNAFEGLGSQGVPDLKQRYGSLKVMQDVLDRRVNVADRANPVGFYEGLGRWAGAGKMVRGAWSTLLGHPREGIPDIAQGAMLATRGKNLQLLNNPEYLLQQALSKTEPREAIPDQPEILPPRGYLPPGPIELGGPTQPDEVSSQPANYTIQRDPRTGRMRKMYVTSPGGERTYGTLDNSGTEAGKSSMPVSDDLLEDRDINDKLRRSLYQHQLFDDISGAPPWWNEGDFEGPKKLGSGPGAQRNPEWESDMEEARRRGPGTAPEQAPQGESGKQLAERLGEKWPPEFQRQFEANKPDAEPFYSRTEQAAQKLPLRASSNQMLATLRNNGASADELKYTGLEKFLQSKPQLTRDEVLSYIKQNPLRVGVQVSGYRRPPTGAEINEVAQVIFGRDFGELTPREQAGANEFATTERDDAPGESRYAGHQLPGGTNYREMLLKLPELVGDTRQNYFSPHWDEPDVLAHVRMNDRIADGKKTLFLEELQSDWHQQGRQKGYGSVPLDTSDWTATLSSRHGTQDWIKVKDGRGEILATIGPIPPGEMTPTQAIHQVAEGYREELKSQAIPDAPFKKDWHELALKQVLRYAAENGYDRVAWTPGETQVARYDLSKQVSEIHYAKYKDGSYKLQAVPNNSDDIMDLGDALPEDKLADYVGKEVAQKIVAGEGKGARVKVLSGSALKIGGKGMRDFYDKIIPQFLNRYGKKWGAKVGETEIQAGEDGSQTLPTGQVENREQRISFLKDELDDKEITQEEFDKQLKEINEQSNKLKAPAIELTPQMKHDIMKKGQPISEVRSPSSETTT